MREKSIITVQSMIRQRYWYTSYLQKIRILINNLYTKKDNIYFHESTFFGDDSPENIKALEIAFRQRQKKMKEGELAQLVIGNWYGWEDLKTGHPCGLDCRKKDNTIIIELKNKWNTCNSGSQKALLDKLAKYKKANPKTRCIWGIVNPRPGEKKLSRKIIHNGVEIEKVQGTDLFSMVFSIGKYDYSQRIIKAVREIIRHY